MAGIEIIEVQTRGQLKEFVLFQQRLYADCPTFVPPLISDELASLSRDHNPAYETADATILLAVRGGETAGRIAGIISHTANKKFGTKNARFGWFDCKNDYAVAAALFDAVERWAKSQGMETITGPQGFNQFSKVGMLVEGFEHLPTVATYYNHAYYNDLVTRYGFVKDVDYVEYLILNIANHQLPPRLEIIAEKVRRRGRYRVLNFPKKRDMLRRANEIFDLLQDTYAELYGVTPITPSQRKYYVKKFFPFLHESLVKVAVNERNQMVGFFIAMPSLSMALQKARGRLLPFGAVHLWRASRGAGAMLDFCLAGVRKHCRGRGVDLLMAREMFKSISTLGFAQAESNPELESNRAVRAEWKSFDHILHKRRRVYKKTIGK